MAVKHVSIDIETYSSVDIRKSGLYKYAQSPDFEVLLIAYSIDGEPVKITEPKREFVPDELTELLMDPSCIKHAYNAAFEWYCLSIYFGIKKPAAWLPQWRCTQLHGLYLGYPAGLAEIGEALKLPQDKKKLSTGKALINYFCKPCRPTRANGMRTRNYPSHAPEKWELFKDYCRRDVETEMAVERRLSAFPVPDEVQRQWELDQRINTAGVALDTELIAGAVECSELINSQLIEEAARLTGLSNPKSVKQLRDWLEKETSEDISSLNKENVAALMKTVPQENARRVLEIRQELGKTSVTKYTAMQNAICADGRARGLIQFYGANRTGRWAGRLVQVQNLPRTYIETLGMARELVKNRDLFALKYIYGNVPDTLSQLIRTAFIPAPGNLFAVADFSAIEARVIAWLAGESWRQEVFATHGKIYEASASQMFHVPIERIKKGNPEYAYRAKGKVAELALGYQGSVGALKAMGADKMGLSDDELLDIVTRWREASPRIRDLWYKLETAAVSAVKFGQPSGVQGLIIDRETDPANGLDFLTIRLPSGRKLYYPHPEIACNEFNKPAVHYWGAEGGTRKWTRLSTYGGKLTENVVQAIARDCLAVTLERLENTGYQTVMHIHDEAVVDCPAERADLDTLCGIMKQPISWAPGLVLNAAGFVGEYYKKD